MKVFIELLGRGWSGIDANDVELSKAEALSTKFEYRSIKDVESEVDVLSETDAPEIDRNVVVSSEQWTFDEETRAS
ncbi:hypothetical protein L1987_59851 [Smallanthus sonchifolius]|uniref:Uncharacterized protein n=1 Tax=Smallanthus sonchifolius TaxID=185202 RepID=A0ACB9D6N0_9ASTR|nr:hypothetical protein L1987_59851 [Smallanthus sonchifolius]